jgi:hypothetical protein
MDLSVTATNRKFYNLPSDISALLLSAFPDVFTRVVREPARQADNQPPVPPAEPTFYCSTNQNQEPTLVLALPGGAVYPFSGRPEEADTTWQNFRGVKLRPSKQILAQYKAAVDRANAGRRLQ